MSINPQIHNATYDEKALYISCKGIIMTSEELQELNSKIPALSIKTPDGKQHTYVFYRNLMSNRNTHLEKNHEYIQYVILKGKSMYKYTQADITFMASHINSTACNVLNWSTSFDLAGLLLVKRILVLTRQ